MRGWRPGNWPETVKAIKPPHPPIMYLDGRLLFSDGVEGGADQMHQADIEWLRDRLKMTADGSIEILCTRTDWEHFSGR